MNKTKNISERKLRKTKIKVNFAGLVSLFILYFLNGKQAFGVIMLCALVHEAGHFFAMALCGVKADIISLGFFSFNITYNKLKTSYGTDIFISSAGVIFNAVLSALAYCLGFYDVAVTSAVLGVLNLLPISGLDGGNILSAVILCLKSDVSKKEVMQKNLSSRHKKETLYDGKINLYSKIFTPVFLCFIAVATGFNVSVTFSGALTLICEAVRK